MDARTSAICRFDRHVLIFLFFWGGGNLILLKMGCGEFWILVLSKVREYLVRCFFCLLVSSVMQSHDLDLSNCRKILAIVCNPSCEAFPGTRGRMQRNIGLNNLLNLIDHQKNYLVIQECSPSNPLKYRSY
uniref:Uncharacterized protein n=1 Tax=Opuntia streptacantha TaxID=393608 RepID=A0A7C9CFX0_OPUST